MHSQPEMPPGFRFWPTDEELIDSYLKKKVSDKCFSTDSFIPVDRNVYVMEPWKLSGANGADGEGKEFYCFTMRKKKHDRGMKADRKAGNGYWKVTGRDKKVFNWRGQTIGLKRSLVFKGSSKESLRTQAKKNWIMHEYRLLSSRPREFEEWVLCRIKESNRLTESSKEPITEEGEDEEARSGMDDVITEVDNGVTEENREESTAWPAHQLEELTFDQLSEGMHTPTLPIASTSQILALTNFIDDSFSWDFEYNFSGHMDGPSLLGEYRDL